MNSNMARGTSLIPRIQQVVRRGLRRHPRRLPPKRPRAVVAFQTQREHHRPPQQLRIRRPVRRMARIATLHPNTRMFINKWPALIHMALQAGLLIVVRRRNQPRPRPRPPGRRHIAVRIMAIRTLHRTLIHPVLRRHRKLTPYRRMTLITKLRLLFRQQKLRRRRLVHRVAVRTNHIRPRMRRLPNPRPRNVLRMATQAGRQYLIRRKLRKRLNRRLPALRGHMVSTRSVATLTPRILRRFFTGSNRLKVRVLVEVQPHIRVARPAGCASHKGVLRTRGFLRCRGLRHCQKWQTQAQRE